MAPPNPCIARAVMSVPMFGAIAAPADASVKIVRPIANRRRRPNRSPSAAPLSRKTAKLSVYALTVHSSPSRPASSLTRMTGRALVTTRLSIDTMNAATQAAIQVQTTRGWVVAVIGRTAVVGCIVSPH